MVCGCGTEYYAHRGSRRCPECVQRWREERRMPCGTKAAYRRGCRCAACRKANAEHCKTHRRRRRLRVERGESHFHHGARGYSNWGCRCDECVSGHKARMVADRESRIARKNDAPHGTMSGYGAWDCRCDECKEAARIYRKQHPRNQRANQRAKKPDKAVQVFDDNAPIPSIAPRPLGRKSN